MKKNSKNKRIFEVLWTVDAVLRLLESHLHFKVDKMNCGGVIFTKKKEKCLLRWGTPTLENPRNCWKNPDFRVFPEKSHPCFIILMII
jgi:hypothetical protein